MKKKPQAIVTISRGYARNAKDEARLRAKGVKIIYRADKGETLGQFKMRQGEYLGVVDGLKVFGDGKREMVAGVRKVHELGATIIDVETDKCSRRDGAEMLVDAIAPLRPSDEYKSMQAASVRERVKGRMDKRTALTIWRNPKLSVGEAIELMTKWTQATAYKRLGKRDVPAGRRPK